MAVVKTLFLDTNILLSFYHLTSEDIEELKKLIALIDSNQIKLVLTEQVKNEFQRNRGNKISDAIRRLREAKFNLSFPTIAKGYADYTALRELFRQADEKHSSLIVTLISDAKEGKLSADNLVSELLKKAEVHAITNQLYLKALQRVRLGNPPGKEQSLGDAINWECLLAKIPEGSDVNLISEDKDFRSQLFAGELNEFLVSEWKDKKKSELFFYPKISDFFKANFPEIKIASEVATAFLIQELANSGSFSHTHTIIAKLSKQPNFTSAQIEQLIQVPEYNHQVGWIVGDADVYEFYKSLQANYVDKLSPVAAEALAQIVKSGEPQAAVKDDSIPF